MIRTLKKTALLLALATLIGTGAGTAPSEAEAATLLDLPSSIVSSGWFSHQTFTFDFSITEAFTDLKLSLTNGNEQLAVPFLGNMPLIGSLFTSATLTDTAVSWTKPQFLASGDLVDTFSGVIGPGDYSLQLNFLQLPLPTDFQGSLSATAVVPEPAEWMMMLGGLAVVGIAARRRAKSRAGIPSRLLPA